MRNVMVRCIFSALSVGLCIVGILGQEIHRYQWTDQQVLADEWKPFVPGFIPQRQFETYPARPDSSRQFFGKTPEPLQQNPYKKSFQTAASTNNIEPYAVPQILGSFNTFGLQSIQARNPSLEKNIKDNQFLEQGSHLHPKFYPQNSQQPQRFPQPPPAFVQPQHAQYLPNQQHQQQQHYGNQFRLENPIKSQSLLQSPTRTIQSSVQVFPPNPPNHYQQNAYFLGVPQNEEEEYSRKQNVHRPNDFLLNTNSVATIYGSRDPTLNIPPPALKPTPFIRNEQIQQDHFLYDNNNLKSIQRYEGGNTYNKRPYETQQVKHIDIKKPQDDNPSKQVYEQLSHFGRPFSLPKESVTEYTHLKSEPNSGVDYNQGYDVPVEHYKKDRVKPSQLHTEHKTSYGRAPVKTTYPQVSTTPNVVLDYEPAKLQNVKTVTYVPQRDVLQFNEEDISGGLKNYQNNENFNSYTRTPFLPTPTEDEDDLGGFGNQQRFTTPSQKVTSSLPKNHKYGSIQHTGTRNRYQPNYQNQEPAKYHTTTTESKPIASYDENIKYAAPTQPSEYANDQQYETTTKKSGSRRRKPSKVNKNKEQTRYKFPTFAEATATSTANVDSYFGSNDVSTTEATIQHTTAKKKQTKYTTSKPDEDYPNYPQYVKQQENYPNYPKEYFQNTQQHNTYDNQETAADYFNSEKEEEKENYPQISTSASTTTTTTPEPTTTSLKARIKNKYANSTRPRFSIKDYKKTSSSTQSTPTSTTELVEEVVDTEKKNIRKFNFASRSKNKTETTKAPEESTSESIRKYKPRTRPSKFRTSSTTPAPVTDSTSERVNTFKPSTSNRYKSSTSKYYNRFRTTTEITTNDADEPSVAASDKKPVRTMLFSAKRSALLRSKSTTPKFGEAEDEEEIIEEDDLPSPSTLKKTTNTQYKPNTKLEKADDASQTSIMTSSEEQNEKKEIKQENNDAQTSVDITASSEEEMDDFSDMLDLKENDVPVSSSVSPVTAEDRMDDADKVSKVSSLTSIDESDIPISFFQKWSSNDNQNQ